MSLVINEVSTFPLRIKIDCPVAKGFFDGHARIRSKPENKALFERIASEELDDDVVIRDIYESFSGLPCEKGKEFDFILNGPASAYLVPAVLQAYLDHYNQARVGNSRLQRGR